MLGKGRTGHDTVETPPPEDQAAEAPHSARAAAPAATDRQTSTATSCAPPKETTMTPEDSERYEEIGHEAALEEFDRTTGFQGPTMPKTPEALDLLRLAQHLLSEIKHTDLGRCELADKGGDRCEERASAVRWEDNFADLVCEDHARNATARGVLVVYPNRHDGQPLAKTAPS